MSKYSNRQLLSSKHLAFTVWLLVTIVLWGFIGMHAFTMDITHDESYSFRLIKTNYFKAMSGTANTHWLNSFFMKIFNLLLGNDPGFLRLHSVLIFPFFSAGILKLSKLIPQKPLQYAFCAVALLNPYLLDFFALARGYGMAVTFQVWALLFFVKAAGTSFNYRSWLKVWWLSVLMIASNLSYFYTLLPVAMVLTALIVNKKYRLQQPVSRQEYKTLFLFAILLVFTVADLLFIKYYGHDLEYGSSKNLVGSIFGSVWYASLYFSSLTPYSSYFAWASFILLCGACTYYSVQQYKQRQLSTGFLLCVPVAGIIVLNIVFHLILRSPYLLHRTALQCFIPSIMLLSFFFTEWRIIPSRMRFVPVAASALAAVTMAIHCYTKKDTRFCFEWYAHGNTRQPLYDLYEMKPQHPYINKKIGLVFTNYYCLIDSLFQPAPKLIPVVDSITSSNRALVMNAANEADYMLISQPVVQQILEQEGIPFTILQTYPLNNNKLVLIRH